MTRSKVRQLVLLVMVVDFPLLYLSATTPEAAATTVATLVVMGAATVAAAVAY